MQAEQLSASLEDYIEVIFHIVAEKKAARAKDIAERMGVTGASVTGALRALSKRELVNHQPYDIVTLTDKGAAVAEQVVGRHRTLKAFLVQVLGIAEDEAEDCACKMEHALPQNIFDRLIEYMEFRENTAERSIRWDAEKNQFVEG